MSRAERAKQFMPFAALRGYGDAIKEKEKVITEKKELTDEQVQKLSDAVARLKKGDVVKAVYYEKDGYVEKTGAVSKIDGVSGCLYVIKTRIPFIDLLALEKIGDEAEKD